MSFSDEEVTDILRLLKKVSGRTENSIYADVFLFALSTGMRAGEILELKFSDVKFEDEQAVFNVTKARQGLSMYIHLPDLAFDIIQRRRSQNPNDTYVFESNTNRSKGNPISRISVHRKFKEVGGMVQKKITFNSLRHHYVTYALKEFQDPVGLRLDTTPSKKMTKLYSR